MESKFVIYFKKLQYKITEEKTMGNFTSSNEHKEYHRNGVLKRHYFEKNGTFDGLYRVWYPNGQLGEQAFFDQGECNGELVKFDPIDGSKTNQLFYVDDKEHGELKCWDEGRLTKHGLAEHGKLILMFKGNMDCYHEF